MFILDFSSDEPLPIDPSFDPLADGRSRPICFVLGPDGKYSIGTLEQWAESVAMQLDGNIARPHIDWDGIYAEVVRTL